MEYYYMKQVSNNHWKEWVRFAQNDLGIATREMERECNPRHRAYEAILAHCQQSAEKMLKAYIIKNVPSINPKVFSHDLEAIRIECASLDKSFNSPRFIKHVTFLSAFVTARYPDFWFSIDASHAKRGLNSAKRISELVLSKIDS
jgi:HEPN domain-containing protein